MDGLLDFLFVFVGMTSNKYLKNLDIKILIYTPHSKRTFFYNLIKYFTPRALEGMVVLPNYF